MTKSTILWRRLDQPGHEFARVIHQEVGWQITGTAIFAYDYKPCQLDYQIACDARWRTLSGRVEGWVGYQRVEIDVSVDPKFRWRLNGADCFAAAGCTDLDLNFSPSTNLLAVRRLQLGVGQAAEVKAAWLRFPSFTLESLEQRYERISENVYRYESAGGQFMRELQVDEAGFIKEYPDYWREEAG